MFRELDSCGGPFRCPPKILDLVDGLFRGNGSHFRVIGGPECRPPMDSLQFKGGPALFCQIVRPLDEPGPPLAPWCAPLFLPTSASRQSEKTQKLAPGIPKCSANPLHFECFSVIFGIRVGFLIAKKSWPPYNS